MPADDFATSPEIVNTSPSRSPLSPIAMGIELID
jgi:hypothetical protein